MLLFREIMMNFTKWNSIFTLLLIGLFASCQTESTVETYSTRETITKTTPLSNYIQRVAMNPTAQDNTIDRTSCFMIKFPYAVRVNNVNININNSNDYQLVIANINANPNDKDIVIIQFPVTVILNNYSEKTVSNQMSFTNLIAECQSNSNSFGKINCLTINFPITINIYNSSNQIATTSTITDSKMLYVFFENLEENKFIAITYPVNVTNSNGQNSAITSNSQFEDYIKNTIDTCPENTPLAHDFMQVITSTAWKISYYYHKSRKTSAFDGFSFVFNSNFKVVATKAGISYPGRWFTKVDNGVREFEMKFESNLLKELDEGWKVFEFNATQLRFNHKGGNVDNDYLYFEKE
jgi:hypothetical protein